MSELKEWLEKRDEAKRKFRQLLEEYPMPYETWSEIFDEIWEQIDDEEAK